MCDDAGVPCVAASITGRCMHTRAVANTGEQRDHKHQNQDKRDDPKHLHPAWCATHRSLAGLKRSLRHGCSSKYCVKMFHTQTTTLCGCSSVLQEVLRSLLLFGETARHRPY